MRPHQGKSNTPGLNFGEHNIIKESATVNGQCSRKMSDEYSLQRPNKKSYEAFRCNLCTETWYQPFLTEIFTCYRPMGQERVGSRFWQWTNQQVQRARWWDRLKFVGTTESLTGWHVSWPCLPWQHLRVSGPTLQQNSSLRRHWRCIVTGQSSIPGKI
jgi:hypothetical protein